MLRFCLHKAPILKANQPQGFLPPHTHTVSHLPQFQAPKARYPNTGQMLQGMMLQSSSAPAGHAPHTEQQLHPCLLHTSLLYPAPQSGLTHHHPQATKRKVQDIANVAACVREPQEIWAPWPHISFPFSYAGSYPGSKSQEYLEPISEQKDYNNDMQ